MILNNGHDHINNRKSTLMDTDSNAAIFQETENISRGMRKGLNHGNMQIRYYIIKSIDLRIIVALNTHQSMGFLVLHIVF